MKLKKAGKNISNKKAEIQSVSQFGIWIYVKEREYFLSYAEYPWFQEATVKELFNFKLLHGRHLHWPSLDVDLLLESLEKPEHYPLRSHSKSIRKSKAANM